MAIHAMGLELDYARIKVNEAYMDTSNFVESSILWIWALEAWAS